MFVFFLHKTQLTAFFPFIYYFFFPSWNALFFFLHNYRNGKGKVYESFLCLLCKASSSSVEDAATFGLHMSTFR